MGCYFDFSNFQMHQSFLLEVRFFSFRTNLGPWCAYHIREISEKIPIFSARKDLLYAPSLINSLKLTIFGPSVE